MVDNLLIVLFLYNAYIIRMPLPRELIPASPDYNVLKRFEEMKQRHGKSISLVN